MAETGILSSGALRSINRRRAIELWHSARASQNTSSATFAAVTNASKAIVWPGGPALVLCNVTHFVSGGGGAQCHAQYRLTDGSTALTSVWTHDVNNVGAQHVAAFSEIVTLPRGAYTIQLEWANGNTVGTLHSDGDGYMHAQIIPVYT